MRMHTLLFIDKDQARVLALSLSMFMSVLTEALGDDEDTDITVDELSDLMSTYATAGTLWSKLLRMQGIPMSEIREALMRDEKE
jgi:hypothetical protein